MARIRDVRPFLPPPPYTYRVDGFAEGAAGDRMTSHPAKHPAPAAPGQEIRAETAPELIRKLWGGEV